MHESPPPAWPLDQGRLHFRARTTDQITDIHLESQRLMEEARTARERWLEARARLTLVHDRIVQGYQPESEGLPDRTAASLLQQERDAHALSKMALERELTRGRRLEDEVLSIQDQERARLARDLHDGICQSLGAVTFMLEMHVRQLEALEPASKPAQSGQKVRAMLSHTLQEMRGLSHELSGVEACAQGEDLCAALHALAERLNDSEAVRCVVVCPELPTLDEAKGTHLYRIAQEAVSNALRHGKAEHVEIGVARVNGQWRLTVTDDGVGVPEKAVDGRGLGMRSMTYRAAVIGGVLTVNRGKTNGKRPGTVVGCSWV